MTRMTLEPGLRSRLARQESEGELRDDQGTLVGYFVPPSLHREMILAWSRAQVSDAELAHARQEPGGRSLAEIWKNLASR